MKTNGNNYTKFGEYVTKYAIPNQVTKQEDKNQLPTPEQAVMKYAIPNRPNFPAINNKFQKENKDEVAIKYAIPNSQTPSSNSNFSLKEFLDKLLKK